MGLPLPPLFFVHFFAGCEDLIAALLAKRIETGRQLMVDEDVFGDGDLESRLSNPAAVVIIFEESRSVGLIKKAHMIYYFAREGNAEKCQCRYFET